MKDRLARLLLLTLQLPVSMAYAATPLDAQQAL